MTICKRVAVLCALAATLFITSAFSLADHIDPSTYDPDMDYEAAIVNILEAEDSEYAVAIAEVYELLHIGKVQDMFQSSMTTGNFREYKNVSDAEDAFRAEIGKYSSAAIYINKMISSAEDGSAYALKMGRIYERLRNHKIKDMGLDAETTSYFTDYSTGADILNAMFPPAIKEEPAPPVPENDVQVAPEQQLQQQPDPVLQTQPIGANESEVDLLARVLYLEAGSSWIPDNTLYMVCSVIVNRINSTSYPNTLNGVIYQSGQFACTGSISSCRPTDRCYSIARDVLSNGSTIPANILYFANFTQGSGTYATDNGLTFVMGELEETR